MKRTLDEHSNDEVPLKKPKPYPDFATPQRPRLFQSLSSVAKSKTPDEICSNVEEAFPESDPKFLANSIDFLANSIEFLHLKTDVIANLVEEMNDKKNTSALQNLHRDLGN